jgi:hypothetical protein
MLDRLPNALALMVGEYLMHLDVVRVRASCRVLASLDWGLTVRRLDVGHISRMAPRTWQRLVRTAWRLTEMRIELSSWKNPHTTNLVDVSARCTRLTQHRSVEDVSEPTQFADYDSIQVASADTRSGLSIGHA